MADMFLGSTQGAVESLLGRLTSVLADEARLLSGVRADVHFIKDEMESMNAFLLNVAEANAGNGGEEDHGVRAWMKQVAEVAYASQNCVDLYARSNGMGTTAGHGRGILFSLCRLPRLLWTLPTRHRIAVQIRELKVRSREVGERRLRYGVEAPQMSSRPSASSSISSSSSRHRSCLTLTSSSSSLSAAAVDDDDDCSSSSREQEDARRRALAKAEPAPFESFSLVGWMTEDGGQQQATPRVIALVGTMGGQGDDQALRFAKAAYLDPWVASSCSLDCMAMVKAREACPPAQVLRDVLAQLEPEPEAAAAASISTGTGTGRCSRLDDERQLVERIRQRLRGRKFLLLLHDVPSFFSWSAVKSAFLDSGCVPGSAILITTQSLAVAYTFMPSEIYDVSSQDADRHDYHASFYLHKAVALVANNNGHQSTDLEPVLRSILKKLASQTTTCRLFIHTLYVDPNKTLDDLKALRDQLVLDDDSSSSCYSNNLINQKEVVLFLYNGLPRSCKNCLLYLSIFPERTTFRRTRLVRRWAAEGTVSRRGRLSALDRAERCFDMLVARKLLTPKDTDATGRIKSCVMHDLTHDLVAEVARDADLVSANLPPHLAHRISIRDALFERQQAAPAAQQRHVATSSSRSKGCWNIFSHFFRSTSSSSSHREDEICESDAFFLNPIPLSSTQLGLLQVLDLEDCKDFKDHQLKHICDYVFQLKYLSLRNTGITKLPKRLGRLRYLETLDIRQTKVRAFPKKSYILPKLKHLLAGVKTARWRSHDDGIQEEESLHTIQMPKHIGGMTELQVLSYVAVSGHGDELIDIGSLLQLRKLGLVVHGSQNPTFRHLFHAIGKLSRCLQSLSICIVFNNENSDDTAMEMEESSRLLMPPRYLRHLKVSGMVNGLTDMVEDLRELTKITIHKTFLTAGDIKIIGRIPRLSYLRFRQESFSERTLNFSKGGFQNLKYLVIDCLDVISINFDEEATPRLEKIIWFSTGTQCLTGIEQLPSLKELHLTGNFDNESMKQAIASNINNPILKTN